MTEFFTYVQRTGIIGFPNPGRRIQGYSGHGEGKNNPAMEAVRAVGPIPAGWWRITRWDDRHGEKGPTVAVLAPVGHDAHGRTDFLVHGDSASNPGGASLGCIIVPGGGNRVQMRQTGIEWIYVAHEADDFPPDLAPPVDTPPLVA